jgi:MFS family permease
MYSLSFVVLAQVAPLDRLGMYTGILSSIFALASLLGPILGGVTSDQSTWRVSKNSTPGQVYFRSNVANHSGRSGYFGSSTIYLVFPTLRLPFSKETTK